MSNKKRALIIFLVFSFILPLTTYAQDVGQEYNQKYSQLQDVRERIRELEKKIAEAQVQERTLANQISYLNNSIHLTELEISETQGLIIKTQDELIAVGEDIESLEKKLNVLNESIEELSKVLKARIRVSYELSRISPWEIFLSSETFQELVYRYAYITALQYKDRELMAQMKDTRGVYEEQKVQLEELKATKEDLKAQLESQRATLEKKQEQLAQQKRSREYFLEVTRGEEARYQQLLAEALRERESLLQAIDSLRELVKNPENGERVERGDIIGIQGSSGVATGAHLHFGAYRYTEKDFVEGNASLYTNHVDPSSLLDFGNGIPIYPIAEDKWSKCSQPYGVSWISKMVNDYYRRTYGFEVYPGDFHNGIDMYGEPGAAVRAAKAGTAYTLRGGKSGANGVFIFHEDGLMTLFWHLR